MSTRESILTEQAASPLKVKFVWRGKRTRLDIWLRQFPDYRPVWDQCHFSFDPEDKTYDWLVVYDDLPTSEGERFSRRAERLACPRANTLLITSEPSSVKFYGAAFLDQFGHVLTGHEPWIIKHPGAIFSQPALRWYYGVSTDQVRTFEQMEQQPPIHKVSDISTVCSSKQQKHTLHHARYNFVQELKAHLPEMEIFGHGVRFIADKAEALDPFRYHLAIENHVSKHHWTEKLSDSFLGLTLPFYHGCPNAADYFPPESFIPINLDDPAGTAATIRRAIENNEYEKRLPFIQEARRRVLHEYNLFAVISRLIRKHHVPAIASPTTSPPAFILSRSQLLRSRPWLRISMALAKMRSRLST